MENVVPLCHDEGVRVDAGRLAALVADLGEARAEGMVSRAMEEMALRLAQMEQHYVDGDTSVICRDARRLAQIAADVGMTSFARVVSDVQLCAARGDMVGFSATWARLARIGDRSLNEIWDIAAEVPF